MITKAVRGHGSRVRGVVEYLFGPGRAEEHTDPHIVAAHADMLVGDRAPTAFARKALTGELDFHRVTVAPEVTEKFVFHAAVSMAAEDGPLSEEVWRDVAESIAGHLGFTPDEGGPEVRWIAVHHGLSGGGNDHIHLIANLINDEGRKHRFVRPPGVMLGEVRKELEIRHGMRLVGHDGQREHGAGLGPHSRAELQRAERESVAIAAATGRPRGELPPESVRLERAVRAAAGAASSEADFVRELREQRVVVRPRFAAGTGQRVVGYSVALPTGGGGGKQLLWYGGGRLAKDLTLPALRARWETSEASEQAAVRATAAPVWRAPGSLVEQVHVAGTAVRSRDRPINLGRLARHIDLLGEWAKTAQGGDPVAARDAARSAAELTAAAASRLPLGEREEMAAASRALARLAQDRAPGLRTVPGHRGKAPESATPGSGRGVPRPPGMTPASAAVLHAAVGKNQRAGWIAVHQSITQTASLVALAHRSTAAATVEQNTAVNAAARAVAYTAAMTAPAPRRPMTLPEQLAAQRGKPSKARESGAAPRPGPDTSLGR